VCMQEGSFTNDFPYIHQPVGIIEFSGDVPYYTVSQRLLAESHPQTPIPQARVNL
jgi:hypothetical protein